MEPGWQERVIPAALAGLVGAGYGAYKAPGHSPLRGAVIGGAGGLGAGAAMSGMNAFLDSGHARHLADADTLKATLLLGSAGLGLAGGLRGGRSIAKATGLGDENDSVKNDLAELDLLGRGSNALPHNLRSYFKSAVDARSERQTVCSANGAESLGARAARASAQAVG